ncbi:Bcr/CflA family efflux MFS transporter [Marinobacter halodurans]|uniref:Bcr/CflA family efflux transporter n=1 Tax=Marinobacter halodurans TaxID=2528979 RepID=A0ABY1ZHS0_9GAMM|nr:Bcr/CflA family efflux MFS transporter [Marinobacter halodurans]TBW49094.1 Bcr/CflA family efflux MFS transporter [Marinobacter halodurans]
MSKTEPHVRFSLIFALASTMMLGPFSVDTYLPAFPDIADSLGVSTQQVSLSVSVYIFSLALGQLIGGALSDRYGRKVILMSGLAIFAAASLWLALTDALSVFLAGRAIQAVGAGWVLVSIPALVRDRVSGQDAAKLFSMIGLIMVIAPGIAPSIGSGLLAVGPWNVIFVFLALYAVFVVPVLLGTVFRDPVSVSVSSADVSILKRYASVLGNTKALPFIFWQIGSFSVMMLFITHASFIYQEHFGQSEQAFALLFGANIVTMFCVNLANRALLSRLASLRVLQMASALQGLGASLLVAAAAFDWPIYAFLAAMMLTIGVMGAITPNIQACFMEYFPTSGGTAAALLGAAQFGVAGTISALSALLPHTLLAVVLAMAACAAVSFSFMLRSLRREKDAAASLEEA